MLVKKKQLRLSKPFVTEDGSILKEPSVTYEEYGRVDGPVIMVCHGGLNDMHAAGRYNSQDSVAGWWDDCIGPGKSLDTNRFRVISANALGSMYGTTGPTSIDPDTGRSYGPTFPEITLQDMVRFYKVFLEELGISKLHLMGGGSMGSLLTLQMAALYPDFVDLALAVATAGRMTPYGICIHHFILEALQMDPDFNGGYYKPGVPVLALKAVHAAVRILFAHERGIRETYVNPVPDGPAAQKQKSENLRRYVTDLLDQHVAGRDPNSYITLLKAINTYDLGRDAASYEEGVQRIKCPVLIINFTTDSEFPPHYAYELGDILNTKQPGQAKVEILDTDWGHLGCVLEGKKMNSQIAKFIAEQKK